MSRREANRAQSQDRLHVGTSDERPRADRRAEHLAVPETHALQPGEAFLLVNDHDPKPLYYQFKFEHADEFTWDYLEQGPDVWQVRVGKTA